MEKFSYKLSASLKMHIAENLIAYMDDEADLTQHASTFIYNWILTGPEEKVKAFYDVWDIVLKNYKPTTRPILFRACKTRKDNKISSFTESIHCAQKFSDRHTGFLIICDTKETLRFLDSEHKGEYKLTFFPLVSLLKKELLKEEPKIRKEFIEKYLCEDEYIMRTDLNRMYSLKWHKERGVHN